jgi:transglutaminase-like putative cysteine protease
MAPRGARLLVVEVSLLAVTGTVAVGFGRLFDSGGWLVPLLSVGLAAHLAGGVLRRLGLGVWLQVATAAITTLLLMTWTQAADTMRWFLPTTDTLAAFGTAFDEALTLYPEARAPTEPIAGFVLAGMVGIAIIATMADVAAFRLGAEIQALVPPLTLFLFCSLLGSGDHRVTSAAAFTVAALTFVLLVRSLTRRSATTWLPGDDQRGPSALIRVGTSLTAVAALAAMVIAPALPGADDEGLWRWRGGTGAGERIIISPLVDIRARLVNQSSDVAFVVESPEPSYWRMMALDDFDGSRFGLSASFRRVGNNVAVGRPPDPDTTIQQQIEIDALASPYLPAAFQAVRVDTGREPVRWDDRSSTLLLEADQAPRGLTYTVESVLPDHDPEALRAAPDVVLPSIRDRYLEVPELDPRVVELAEQVVAGAVTPYDKALALQNHLRSEYEYSLDVPPGHSDSALARFLFVDRAGYCEQFSAAFAAMARQVGLPSRVAVGFTVGEQSRTNPNQYTVRGEHAHAWPEIWFNGVGWVPFEPTPGRGDPQASEHTGVQPDQSGGLGPAPSTTTSTTVPGDRPLPDLDPSLIPDFDLTPDGATGGALSSSGGGPPRPLVWLAWLAGLVALWCLAVALAGALRRMMRRRSAADPAARTLVAWDEVVEAARSIRVIPDATETYREFARRLAGSISADATPLLRLAEAATTARFSPAVDAAEVEASVDGASLAVTAIRADRSRRERLVDLVDPRRVLPPRRRSVRRRQAGVTSVVLEPAEA